MKTLTAIAIVALVAGCNTNLTDAEKQARLQEHFERIASLQRNKSTVNIEPFSVEPNPEDYIELVGATVHNGQQHYVFLVSAAHYDDWPDRCQLACNLQVDADGSNGRYVWMEPIDS